MLRAKISASLGLVLAFGPFPLACMTKMGPTEDCETNKKASAQFILQVVNILQCLKHYYYKWCVAISSHTASCIFFLEKLISKSKYKTS